MYCQFESFSIAQKERKPKHQNHLKISKNDKDKDGTSAMKENAVTAMESQEEALREPVRVQSTMNRMKMSMGQVAGDESALS